MSRAGRPPALTQASHRARLQAAFLRLYDQDAEFGEALLGLVPLAQAADITHGTAYWNTHAGLWNLASQSWGRHPPEHRPPRIAEITAFVRAADALAADFGLERLDDPGRAYILAWCDRYLRARAAGSAHPSAYGPGRFSTTPVTFTFEPDVGGHIGPPWDRETWDPTRERRADASKRLMRIARDHIQAALDHGSRLGPRRQCALATIMNAESRWAVDRAPSTLSQRGRSTPLNLGQRANRVIGVMLRKRMAPDRGRRRAAILRGLP